jgi:hypothetical protein
VFEHYTDTDFLFHEVSIVIPSFILIFVNIFTIAKYVKYSKMKKKEKKKGKCIFGQVSILFKKYGFLKHFTNTTYNKLYTLSVWTLYRHWCFY